MLIVRSWGNGRWAVAAGGGKNVRRPSLTGLRRETFAGYACLDVRGEKGYEGEEKL